MNRLHLLCAAAAALIPPSLPAAADRFPACPWSEVRVDRSGGRLAVTDSAGRRLLSFQTEGGDFLARVVVSNAADRLFVDAGAAFAAGMRKLVITSCDIGPAACRGRDCAMLSTVGGAAGAALLGYFEGFGPDGHFYRSREIAPRAHRRDFPFVTEVAPRLDSLHLRWDVLRPGKGPLEFFGARYGTLAELPLAPEKPRVKPELVFHAPFDGSAEARMARGAAKPLRAEGLSYAPGRIGGAVRLSSAAKSLLEYAADGNFVPERGTISLWFRREWPDAGVSADGREVWRSVFMLPEPKGARIGSGQLMFWWWGRTLRADTGDDDDDYRCWPGEAPAEGWCHLAMTWDESGARVYVNGRDGRDLSDSASPMADALKTRDTQSFAREAFGSFFVGCRAWGQQIDGLVDDLRVYSAPLSPGEVRELYRRESAVELAATGLYALAGEEAKLVVRATSPAGRDLGDLGYCLCDAAGRVAVRFDAPVSPEPTVLSPRLAEGRYTLRATDGKAFFGAVPFTVFRKGNPYSLAPRAGDVPGRARRMELVDTVVLDRPPAADRYRAVGPVAAKRLGDTPYLEAGETAGDRFAVRFRLPSSDPLWCFEIDYPDDRTRTADLIVQRSDEPWGDYALQVGCATGDEYPNSGRVRTHRCLYWASGRDVTLVAMTARSGQPAAVSAVRLYRVTDGALPAADIRAPEPPADGWGRTLGLYFEDPSIGYEFALPRTRGRDPDELSALVDRTAALMKYTGENLLAYPGAWYHGLIGEDYNPRHHAPDFLRPDFVARANRACGLDGARLTREAPNLVLCQSIVPADYRWRPLDHYPDPSRRAHQRILDTLPGTYSLLDGADFPWVNQHDRYWESPIGSSNGPGLSCDWLKECGWRVSTINPGGTDALRHFVLPLRYHDVLGMSKGGFLIGTYGMEDVLVPFARAFRSLPPVRFDDCGGDELVKFRHAVYRGDDWYYLVNTDRVPRNFAVKFPAAVRDPLTDARYEGDAAFGLGPYELRVFRSDRR